MQHMGKAACVGENLMLYDRYTPKILAYLERRIGHRQDAEDLLVDVFLAAFKAHQLADLHGDEQLAWLRRVAHNKVVDRLRQARRLTHLSLDEVVAQESSGLPPRRREYPPGTVRLSLSADRQPPAHPARGDSPALRSGSAPGGNRCSAAAIG